MAESFQYALLRLVPSLPRGEALNVGIVLHCRRGAFIGRAQHEQVEWWADHRAREHLLAGARLAVHGIGILDCMKMVLDADVGEIVRR